MGGTFDPIHYGHLVAAEEAYSSLQLSEVIFVPTGSPPHKSSTYVSHAEHRYTMTLLATLDNPHFRLSRIEIERDAPSHTIDTLREMQHWYIRESVEFYFITGMDAVLNIHTWKEPDEIAQMCRIVAVGRPGYDTSGLGKLAPAITNSLVLLHIPLLSISSTEVRSRIQEGRSIRYLVPWLVEHYLYKNALYIRSGR